MAASIGKLSTIVLLYNKESYIESCLKSILRQIDYFFEVIVIDDDSSDKSLERALTISEKHEKITVIHNKNNIGTIANLKRGAEIARGDYIHFLGGEDIILDGFAEKSLKILAKYPESVFCCGEVYSIDEDNIVINKRPFFSLSKYDDFISATDIRKKLKDGDNFFSNSSVIYNRRMFLDNGSYREELGSLCDGIYTRFLAIKYGFCFISAPIAAWRQESNSYSSRSWENTAEMIGRIEEVSAEIDLMISDTSFHNYGSLLRERLTFDLARLNPRKMAKIPNIEGMQKIPILGSISKWLRCVKLKSVAEVAFIASFWPYDATVLASSVWKLACDHIILRTCPMRIIDGRIVWHKS